MTDFPALGGIMNMGQTCYGNSIIQCFRHCDKIPWMFEEGRYSTLFKKNPTESQSKKQDFTSAFANMIQLLQKCRRGQSVRPADFWANFKQITANTGFEHLSQRIAHDSHEFYLCVLDNIHESIAQDVDMKISLPPPVSEREKHRVAALESWKQEFNKKYSPLVALFYGLYHIIVECKGCHNKTHRWETFTSLKGVVGTEPATLLEMLQAELKPETIPEYHCEKCPTRQDAVKSVYIWRLPLYVTVVLKRFSPDGRKLHAPVKLEGDVCFESMFSDETPERAGQMTYRLQSVVDHHGGASGGHYTAQCRSPQGGWNLYDDETAHEIKEPMIGSSTYMLWFDRISP
jgi:ubiquitin C-terminal hydrolase